MERHPARASASVVLRKDEMVRLERAHFGKEIHAQEGLLWITGSGTGDILLRSGESFLLDDKGPFLVQGLVDSRWHLLP